MSRPGWVNILFACVALLCSVSAHRSRPTSPRILAQTKGMATNKIFPDPLTFAATEQRTASIIVIHGLGDSAAGYSAAFAQAASAGEHAKRKHGMNQTCGHGDTGIPYFHIYVVSYYPEQRSTLLEQHQREKQQVSVRGRKTPVPRTSMKVRAVCAELPHVKFVLPSAPTVSPSY